MYITPRYNLPVTLVLDPFGAPRGKVGFCVYAAGTTDARTIRDIILRSAS